MTRTAALLVVLLRVILSLARQIDPGAILPRIDELAAALSTTVRTDVPPDLLDELSRRCLRLFVEALVDGTYGGLA